MGTSRTVDLLIRIAGVVLTAVGVVIALWTGLLAVVVSPDGGARFGDLGFLGMWIGVAFMAAGLGLLYGGPMLKRGAAVLTVVLLAGASPALASPQSEIASTVEGLISATGVTVTDCTNLGSHVRCHGELDLTNDDAMPQHCSFVAREYPHGKQPGDADGFVDLKLTACRRTTKAAVARRQRSLSHRR